MKLAFKYCILLFLFFVTLLTSLMPDNVYLLFVFSCATFILLPSNGWWDNVCVALLIFSLMYCLNLYLTHSAGSGFVFMSLLLSPVAFYRFGRWVIVCFENNEDRLKFLFMTQLSFLLPVFALTIQDIALVGFVNESREMFYDFGKYDSSLAATLYGLVSSTGIGFISLAFAKQIKPLIRVLYCTIAIISMLVVIHLVNRTGIVIFFVCVAFSLVYTAWRSPSRIVSYMLALFVICLFIIKTGVVSQDIVDAYVAREDSVTANSLEFGGRSVLWGDALLNLITHPFGWNRVRYAHNLWLDLAAVGGWLAFIPFVIATLTIIKKIFLLVRYNSTPIRLLLIASFLSMFCNSMVEPVIEGSLLFFVLFIMNWGMISSYSNEI